LLEAVATGALAMACGSSTSDNGGDAGPKDSAVDTAHDVTQQDVTQHDVATPGYPAFPVDYPQVLKNQDAILEAPVLVTISWPGDTNASTWEAFGDAIGPSTFWAATTGEYGLLPIKSGDGNHVRMTQPLGASISYTDVETFVTAEVEEAQSDAGVPDAAAPDGGAMNPKWPAPTLDAHGNVQTVYSLFIPANTAVTDPGTGMSFCLEGATGYHDQIVANGAPVAFAINLNCAGMGVPGVEETAAHETIEGSTDPYVNTASLGYIGFDPDHLAWDLLSGYNDELSDACQNWQDSYFLDTGDFPYWVQRSWSNKSALLGHDPCVPAPAGPYHGMTLFPAEESMVNVNLASIGAGTTTSRGFNVTIGKPLTFHVGFNSDAEGPAWTIASDFPTALEALFDTSFNPYDNGKGTISLDKTSGQNGDMATVTVTATEKGEGSFQVIVITWDPPPPDSEYTLPHYLPILLVDQ
jgi:hypothetical protein